MKIASIYTGITPELMDIVNSELLKEAPGNKIICFADPSILSDIIDAKGVTPDVARRLLGLYFSAVNSGADIIYNICSSVGIIADKACEIFKMMNVPIIRIDEYMARVAVKSARSIGVVATLSSALDSTIGLVKRMAREECHQIKIIDILAEGAFQLPVKNMNERIITQACTIKDSVDVFIMAQASMAFCEKELSERSGKSVYSSPKYGSLAVSRELKRIASERNLNGKNR